ncbi:hypothetical protein OIDMADRAFT_39699 [Oidiodendron maius Zn]|uniref:Adenylosuccinate lyase C-terminal domain-containing protein n=1 Tax=Oidiodendron maius (strain Zn) TaxID=913774 RepID=A0A0C3HJS3_OIDMZ|nr:hypothetical protein OIDMADRAFT_39699 [Oidiodendron maius Zn]
MAISVLDSYLFKNLFSSDAIRRVFSDSSYTQYLINAETALARAQAKEGVIPAQAATLITINCVLSKVDVDLLAKETSIVGYPVLPLVEQLVAMCPLDAGKYVHWGATTQDIMDLGSVLQMQKGLQLIRQELVSLVQCLTAMCVKYRDIPMAGRTHLQHALPITFGYKCAVYLSSVQRHLSRLDQLEPRCLLVQLGGAVGTLASLGTSSVGIRVRKALAQELGLYDTNITWHVARDGIAEIINFLALVGASLGKVALDLILMSSTEIGEVSEPFVPHRGASSTMPQKRNPISSELILAASKVLKSNASIVLDAMVSDFERASGPWHLEWIAIPESFILAHGALQQTVFVASELCVNNSKMLQNLSLSRGLIAAEAVMMALAKHTGRQQAHSIVYNACKTCIETNQNLADILIGIKDVQDTLTAEDLRHLCDPINYLGSCQVMIDNVVNID